MPMLAALLVAAALAAPNPRDAALAALAAGEPRKAVAALPAALTATDPALGCLRGRAQRQAGDRAGALATFAALPPAAPCAPNFAQAELLAEQGQGAAAYARFAEEAAPRLGPARDVPFAQWAEGMVDRLVADPDGDVAQAGRVLGLLLGLELPADRRDALALRAAEQGAALRAAGRAATFVAEEAVRSALLRLLLHGEAPLDARHRLALAEVSDGPRALALLDPLPDSPAKAEAQRRALLRAHGEIDDLLRAAWAADPSAPGLRSAVLNAIRSQDDPYDLRWMDLASALAAEEAPLAAAEVRGLEARGRFTPAAQKAEAYLARFPGGADRAEMEQALPRLLLASARAQGDDAAAIAAYDALLRRAPGAAEAPLAAYEAGLRRLPAAPAEARRRWEEVIARYPSDEAAQRALQALARHLVAQDRPAEATALLRGFEAHPTLGGVALTERLRMDETDLAVAVEASEGRRVILSLRVRNLDRVELRLHALDPEAFLRAGQGPADLAALDVGVIAPDRRWTVVIDEARPQRDQLLTLPVDLPGPGYYALTVAGPDREARVVAKVSTTELLARAVGEELAVAVLRGGRPAPGARLWVFGEAEVIEARADRRGLWVGRAPAGALRILAVDGKEPAMIALDGPATGLPPAPPAVELAVDLSRSTLGPDEPLALRLVGRVGGAPLLGQYRLWLASTVSGPVTTVSASPLGTVQAELRAPALLSGDLQLWVEAPGQPPRQLARLSPLSTVRPSRVLLASLENGQGEARLTEADGRPVAGQPLRWTWTEGPSLLLPTDANGLARPPAQPEALPLVATVSLPQGEAIEARPDETARPAPRLRALRETVRSGESLEIELINEAPLATGSAIALSHLVEAPVESAPPADPFVPALPLGMEGVSAWAGAHPLPTRPQVRLALPSVSLPTAVGRHRLVIPLPELPDGPLDLRLIQPGRPGEGAALSLQLRSGDARLSPLPDAFAAGLPVELGAELGPNLVTVEQEGLRAAALLSGAETLTLRPTEDWQGDLQVVLTSPRGATEAQTRPVKADLDVDLVVTEADQRWVIDLTVHDAAGRPALAEVALSAFDRALQGLVAPPQGSTAALRPARAPGESATGMSRRWRFGALAEMLAGALLDEARREEEGRIAALAAKGELSRSRLAGVLAGDAIIAPAEISMGLGGIGTAGGGGGASGYGRGSGSFGGEAKRSSELPFAPEVPLWAVVRTGADGRARLEVPAPRRPSDYAVVAEAISARSQGSDRRTLRSAGRSVQMEAAPDADLPPGQERLRATRDGRPDLLTLAQKPDPALLLGLRPLASPVPGAPPVNPLLRAARRGRALLAAGAPAAEVLSLRMGIAQAGPTGLPIEAAVFFVEANPLDPMPAPALSALVASARLEDSPIDRAMALWAQAAVGLPVEEASLGRYTRERSRLDPVEAAWVGRALLALQRRPEAEPFLLQSTDALALAERTRLGIPVEPKTLPALLQAGPPPVGAPGRAEWIAALSALAPQLPPGEADGGWLLGQPRAEGSAPVSGLRLPPGADGRLPPTVDLYNRGRLGTLRSAGCASGELCRMRLGEGLSLSADLLHPGFVPPPGLRLQVEGAPRGPVLIATALGTTTLRGLVRWSAEGAPIPLAELRVEVLPADAPLPVEAQAALPAARRAAAEGKDPRPLLDALPPLARLSAGERGEALLLRLRATLTDPNSTPADRVARFEDLRDGNPSAALELREVREVAAAYAAIGKVERATAVLRAGLGAAFLAEAAPARQLEEITGPLSSLQALRALVGRYPDLPAVEEALFLAPQRLGALAEEGLPPALIAQGITPTDVRLLAADWNREFLALYPASARAPAAAFDLVSGLLSLRAFGLAAEQASRYADRPSPLSDTLLFLSGVARAELGEDRAASQIFRRLAAERFVQEDGSLGPARTVNDARYALARLDEASGRYPDALRGYTEVQSSWPEAARSAAALRRVELTVDEPIVQVGPGGAVRLPITAVGLDRVTVQAYAIDLRTIFLRDAGLNGVFDISVAGISPALSRSESVQAGPFPTARTLDLPLRGAGAWLVHIDGGGQHGSALVLRSALTLDTSGGRVVVRTAKGQPAAGAEVRALVGGSLQARRADLRGVVDLPPGAILIAWLGEDLAFSLPGAGGGGYAPAPAPAAPPVDLLRNVNELMRQQRLDSDQSYESTFQKSASGMVNAEAL